MSVFNTLDTCGAALSSFDTCGLPTVADRMHDRCRTWGALAAVGAYGRLTLDDLSPWERLHLDRLAQVEAGWQSHVDGGELLHFDLRFDNILVAPAGRVWFLDWGRACTGPRWVDLVCLLLESNLGRINPETAFLAQPRGKCADPDAVDAFLVALASNWRHSADRSPPLHAPHPAIPPYSLAGPDPCLPAGPPLAVKIYADSANTTLGRRLDSSRDAVQAYWVPARVKVHPEIPC